MASIAAGHSGPLSRVEHEKWSQGVARAFPGVFQPWAKGLEELVQVVRRPQQPPALPDSLDPLDLHREGVLLIEGQRGESQGLEEGRAGAQG